jgi:hypothetical protein
MKKRTEQIFISISCLSFVWEANIMHLRKGAMGVDRGNKQDQYSTFNLVHHYIHRHDYNTTIYCMLSSRLVLFALFISFLISQSSI